MQKVGPDTNRMDARSEFAKRLRETRAKRGYRTARSLAKALAIDENRYTRYERAEVEPDLGLIRRICALLSVTPNDLLGTAPAGRHSVNRDRPPGAAASGQDALDAKPARSSSSEALAWKLACLVADVRLSVADPGGTPGADGARPFAYLETATRLFETLRTSPFKGIAEIVHDGRIESASPAKLTEIDELCRRLGEMTARKGDRAGRR